MKQTIRIFAGILAMYLLALPVVLLSHSQSHVDVHHSSPLAELTGDYVDADLDCELCSLFFDQQSDMQSEFSTTLGNISFDEILSLKRLPLRILPAQQYLRGPPVV